MAPIQPNAWAEPRKSVPIVKPDLPIVDSEAYWSRMERDLNGSGKKGSGFGSGDKSQTTGSAGAGSGSGSGNGGTEFTKPGSGKMTEGSTPGSAAQAGASSSGGGSLQIHERWWPICMFMDEGIDQAKANEIIKGVIEKANRCRVNVVVWPRTVKTSSWPPAEGRTAHEAVNTLSINKCNLPPELAAAGSTTALVPPNSAYDNMAAKMCDDEPKKGDEKTPPEDRWNKSVAGCAQLRSGSEKPEMSVDKMKGASGEAHSHTQAKGGVAPSIEVTGGHSADVVSHEAIGHSQMGKPNGSKYGLGIGEESDFTRPGGVGPVTSEWSGEGCAVMYAKALPNTRRFGFDPSRQTYYVKPRDPSSYYDIKNDPPIFGTGKSLSLAAGKGPPQVIPQGQTIVANEENKKATTTPTDLTKSSAGQAILASEADEGGRHPKPKRAGEKLLAASDRGLAEAPELTEEAVTAIERPPSAVPPEQTGKLGINEGNVKARPPSQSVASSDSVDTYSGAAAGVGGAGTSDTTGTNESAPQGAAYSVGTAAGARGGLASSDSITVNEGAEKGANYRGRDKATAETTPGAPYFDGALEEETTLDTQSVKKRLTKKARVPAGATKRTPRGIASPYAEP